MEDGSTGTVSEWGTLQVEARPVFYAEAGKRNFVIFFAGRRWILIEAVIDGVYLGNKTAVVDYIADPTKFNTFQSVYSPFFASDVMDVGEPSDAATPDKLKWFLTRRNSADDDDVLVKWWEPALDEPIDTVLHCDFCDNFENPCENGGKCVIDAETGKGQCQCYPGSHGTLCEKEDLCTDKDSNDMTSLIGCEYNGTCTASGRCTGCPVGYLGSRCQVPVSCSELADILGSDVSSGCFRGGSCGDDGICACPDGFEGAHCQFPNPEELGVDWLV